MKLQIPILAIVLLLPLYSHAADVASQISARYAAVDKAVPSLKPMTRELNGYSGEGGELTAYFQNGLPVKMVARHFFNTFRRTDELYFWQGRLFFVLETKENYDVDSDDDVAARWKVYSRSQNRYYFQNGQLWRWINADGKAIESGAKRKVREKEQLSFARQMLAGARGKARVIEAPKGSRN